MNYDLVRVFRDAEWNKTAAPSARIYDFDVVVGGEVLATFRRDIHSKGYELTSPNHEYIHSRAPAENDYNPDYYLRVKAEKKADFVPLLDGLFAAGRIPSAEENAIRLAGWGRALLEARDVDDAKTRSAYRAKHADELAEIVERASIVTKSAPSIRRDARELLATIDAEARESIAFSRENCPFNEWEAEAVAAFEASIAKGGAK